MLLSEWVAQQGPGSMTRLQRDTALAYTTIFRAVHGGKCREDTALLISKATGGAVDAASLREGAKPKRRPRRR
jgi:hypothetical protein